MSVHVSFLPVRLGETWLVLEARFVREVSKAIAWLPIGGAPRGFPGVLAWNGRAVAVCDLATVLEIDAAPLSAGELRARTLIVALDDDVVALPVDGAREAFTASDDDGRRSPVEGRSHVTELVEHEGALMGKVDIEAIVLDAHKRARGA